MLCLFDTSRPTTAFHNSPRSRTHHILVQGQGKSQKRLYVYNRQRRPIYFLYVKFAGREGEEEYAMDIVGCVGGKFVSTARKNLRHH